MYKKYVIAREALRCLQKSQKKETEDGPYLPGEGGRDNENYRKMEEDRPGDNGILLCLEIRYHESDPSDDSGSKEALRMVSDEVASSLSESQMILRSSRSGSDVKANEKFCNFSPFRRADIKCNRNMPAKK